MSVILSPNQVSLALTVLGLLVIAALVAGFLRWTGVRKRSGINGTLSVLDAFALLLSPVWIALLFGVLYALWRVFDAFDPTLMGSSLRWHVLAFVGLITALGALATAPLALIRVYTTERQTRVAEQGHMTDRISKAVEQLGTEKTVKRRATDAEGNENTVEESVPNIEVRIGGIYALERIAQDSMTTDKGRDHIRVMELLCAYIRENAPAKIAQNHDLGPFTQVNVLATAEQIAADRQRRTERLRKQLVRNWAEALPPPRTDIQTALTVIGRRSAEQIALEHASITPGNDQGYRLDLRNTCLQRADLRALSLARALFANARLEGANLSSAQLAGADLERACMAGAAFSMAQMEGANLIDAQMEGAVLWRAKMNPAFLVGANLEGANLTEAQMEGAQFVATEMELANLLGAKMKGADLDGAKLEGANLNYARLQAANLSGWSIARASLKSADLTGATNLDQSAVNAAFGDKGTILPKGLRRPDHWDNESGTVRSIEAYQKYQAWLAAGAPPGEPGP